MDNPLQFNVVDLVVLALLVLGLIRGLARGLSGELATLISAAAALAAGWFGYQPLGNYLREHTRLVGPAAYAAAFAASLVGAYIAMLLLRFVLHLIMDFAFKGGIERIGGGAAGVVRAGVFCAIALFLLGLVPHAYIHKLFVEDSFFGRLVSRVGVPAYEEFAEEHPGLKAVGPAAATNEVEQAEPAKKERKRRKAAED